MKIIAILLCIVAIFDSMVLYYKPKQDELRRKIILESIHVFTGAVLAIVWLILHNNYENKSFKGIWTFSFGSIYFLITCTRFLKAVSYCNELPQNKTVRKAMKKFDYLKRKKEENCLIKSDGVYDVIDRLKELFELCKNASKLTEASANIWNNLLENYIRIYEKYLKHKKDVQDSTNSENSKTMHECSQKFIAYIEQACKEQEELNHEESFVQSLDFQADAETFVASIDATDFGTQQFICTDETEVQEGTDNQRLQV